MHPDGPEPVMCDLLAGRVVPEVRWEDSAKVLKCRRKRLLERRQGTGHQRAVAHHTGRVLVPVFGGRGDDGG